ncbi:hypothetical protein Bca4012_036658 [Brassica carinata]
MEAAAPPPPSSSSSSSTHPPHHHPSLYTSHLCVHPVVLLHHSSLSSSFHPPSRPPPFTVSTKPCLISISASLLLLARLHPRVCLLSFSASLLLQDCSATAGIWTRIVTPGKQQRFFSLPLLEWLYENISRDASGNGDSWVTLFAMTVWWCWKWRCGYVFGEIGKCRDRVQFVKNKAQEIILSNKNLRISSTAGVRVEKQIAWHRPANSWFKLNTDGAPRGNPGLTTVGGVIWDEYGEWRGGFALNIGIFSASLVELWGVYYGLCIAWDRASKGWR